MAHARSVATLRRALGTAFALGRRGSKGASANELLHEVATSRATLYRDFARLREAGLQVESFEVDGQTRYRLVSDARMPAPGPAFREQIALRLLQSGVPQLADTFVADALAELLGEHRRQRKVPRPEPRKAGPTRDTLETITRAIRLNKRLTFYYRGTDDAREQARTVDPIELRLVRDQLYLVAWDVERDAPRTFKPMRMTRAVSTPDPAAKHRVDVEALLAGSVRVWDGEVCEVVVRLDKSKARFVNEWKLHHQQRVEPQQDGSVYVTANVAGLVEVLRWVLSWGRGARVIAPAELREMVVSEIDAMRAAYGEQEKREGRARQSQKS